LTVEQLSDMLGGQRCILSLLPAPWTRAKTILRWPWLKAGPR